MSKKSLHSSTLERRTAFLCRPIHRHPFVFKDRANQLCQFKAAHRLQSLHERVNPVVVSEDTIHYPAACSDDLHRYPHDPIEKPSKFHSKKLIALLTFAHQQCKPCFQCPGQGCHDHIGPVGDQGVSTGIRNALRPFLSCSMRFSWLHRSLQNQTTSGALKSVLLVM